MPETNGKALSNETKPAKVRKVMSNLTERHRQQARAAWIQMQDNHWAEKHRLAQMQWISDAFWMKPSVVTWNRPHCTGPSTVSC